MYKKILGGIAIVAIAVVAAINMNVNSNRDELSDISLANVEALARDEINPVCPNGCDKGNDGCFCWQWYNDLKEHDW